MKRTDILEKRKTSDYGQLDREACDYGLRQRVIDTVNPARETGTAITEEQRSELAIYITQLEDALLRHHWGVMEPHQIHELLKCATGLDMESLSHALASMTAEDA